MQRRVTAALCRITGLAGSLKIAHHEAKFRVLVDRLDVIDFRCGVPKLPANTAPAVRLDLALIPVPG